MIPNPNTSLLEPDGGHALADAAAWVSGTLTGSVATVVATLAVAFIGFMMLQGRLALRRGLVVVIGCFLIFGARTIVTGLRNLGPAAGDRQQLAVTPIPPAPKAPPQPLVYDPYAGASVPIK
jgi:type IV secretory pathway VirB2 component (pilin)